MLKPDHRIKQAANLRRQVRELSACGHEAHVLYDPNSPIRQDCPGRHLDRALRSLKLYQKELLKEAQDVEA